jgi:type IV pilus assembly protein PilA
MLSKLRRRAEDEKGFTLIELLVVILIIGILAAIAIPAFLNQRSKAYDAAAKSNVRTAQTAMETYATDNQGAYPASVDTSKGASDPLVSIEPSLNNKPYVTGSSTGATYTLSAVANGPSAGADTFVLTDVSGAVTRSCSGTAGGCPSGGTW